MEVKRTPIEGLLVIEPRVFDDDRGYFFETFNLEKFNEATGLRPDFVQDNESFSSANVMRGLHFQVPPKAQAKLVRVTRGSVLDVAVDLRKGSPTYGQHQGIKLSAENKKQFYIPEGFAHGFLTLEENTIFSYKCTDFYSNECEQALRWNDPELNIDWGDVDPVVSEKDRNAPLWSSFSSPFPELVNNG